MVKDNPMNTSLFNCRIKFQARGAAHIYGVLRCDFDSSLPNGIDNILVKSAFNKFRWDHPLTIEEDEIIKAAIALRISYHVYFAN